MQLNRRIVRLSSHSLWLVYPFADSFQPQGLINANMAVVLSLTTTVYKLFQMFHYQTRTFINISHNFAF